MKGPYVGVGRRALATVIDWIPLSIITFVIVNQFGSFDTTVVQKDDAASANSFITLDGTGIVMLLLFIAFYYIGMEVTFGGTIGKLMAGIRVRNADGSQVSFKGAFFRFMFRPIDGIANYLLGAILVWTTSKKQRLGDLVGGSIVCYREFDAGPGGATTEATQWQSY